MGDIHDMKNTILSGTTAGQLRDKLKLKDGTFNKRWQRKMSGQAFDANMVLTVEDVARLSGQKISKLGTSARPKNVQTVTTPREVKRPVFDAPAPSRRWFKWPTFGLSEFLAVAVYGHTALVWYEVALIFGTPGILAGVVLFALKHCAVVVCRSEKFSDYHSDAFGVAFVLDALAVWVHFTAFGDAMPDRFKDGAEFWAALILGLVVASGAFVSLYFTNKTSQK